MLMKLPDFSGKNVLVTGGAGFIGSHLSEKLSSLGADVTILDSMMRGQESIRNMDEVFDAHPKITLEVGDILDFDKMKGLVEGKDFVFHLAALPSHRLALHQPRNYALVDVMGTVNMLESARLAKNNPKVIFASSNKVYGKNQVPFKEEYDPKPEGPYGQAKISSEEFCMQYSRYYGMDTPVVRYHHVIGPRCQPDLVLSIFTERVLNGFPPVVHGHFEKGEFEPCAADFTNIDDAVKGTLLASKVKGFDNFNLGTGKVTTVLELAEIIIKRLGKNVAAEKREMLAHEAMVHRADTTKSKNVIGFEATTPIEESVKQYIDWRLKTGERKAAVYRV